MNKNSQIKTITKSTKGRLWKLDFLRGVAIVLVVIYHFIFNLNYFFDFDFPSYSQGFFYYEGRLSAIFFIILTGVTSSIIYKRHGQKIAWKKNTHRGIRLIAFGMLITLVTWLFDSSKTIWFGILHFLGISIILSTLFLRFKWLNILMAIIFVGIGMQLKQVNLVGYDGLIFGIRPYGFQSFDYYPLLPWLGITIMGVFLGNFIHEKRETLKAGSNQIVDFITWSGKHSLLIYMLHQPILLVTLWLLLK